LALATGAVPARAIDAAGRCESSKLKTAGKYAFCRGKADAKAVKTGTTPDYSKCDEKFTLKWGIAENNSGGACPSNSDESAIQTLITVDANRIAACLSGTCPPGGTCGDGIVQTGEECDLGTLDGETCVSEGFAGGNLACGSGCLFDTSVCWNTRFTDNADGTITDHQYGLTWEKKTERDSVDNSANLHDADNLYPWAGICSNVFKYCQPTTAASTLCVANAEGGSIGCDECTGGDGTCSATQTVWTWAVALNSASFAGHTDWRIPKMIELESIVDRTDGTPPAVNVAFQGVSCGPACTDITNPDCSCTQSFDYWSASPFAAAPESAWMMDFTFGAIHTDGRNAANAVIRAVRSGP
jgi:hypothetical protein